MSAVIQLPSRLDSLLSTIAETKATVESAWRSHYDAVMELKASKLWQTKAKTWQEFLDLDEIKSTGAFFKDSTYRQKHMDMQIAEMITGIVANATLTEAEARRVREGLNKLTHNAEEKAVIYAKAHEASGKLAPSHADLQIAFDIIQRERTYGAVTIGGIDYNLRDEALHMAIAEEIAEKKARQSAYIDSKRQLTSKRLDVIDFGTIQAVFDALGVNGNEDAQEMIIIWKVKNTGE